MLQQPQQPLQPQQPQQMMQQQRYRNIQLQQQQQQQQQQFQQGQFQQPAPPYPRAMAGQPNQYGGPNMMHQNMGPMQGQPNANMTAQQMLAQVRSPPPNAVRSPGPRGPMGVPMGMPRHPTPSPMQD